MELVELNRIDLKFRRFRKRQSFKALALRGFRQTAERKESFLALDKLTFAAKKGEVVGIVGSNGAGKTTLCRVLSKIYVPDGGEMQVKAEITAMLSLGAGFDESLSGKDNVFLNGMMLGFTRRQMKQLYPAIVEFAGIGDFISEPVGH